MSNLRKGLVCGAAGLSAIGVGLHISSTPEITPSSIEACANSLQETSSSVERLPDTCHNSTYTVFPTTEVTSMVVSNPGEEPYALTTQVPVWISADEYSQKAYEVKASKESEVLLKKLAAFALGIVAGGLAYYEWAINTPEHRAAKDEALGN